MADVRRRVVDHLRVDHVEDVTTAVRVKAGVGGVGKQVIVEALDAYGRGELPVIPVRWVAGGATWQLLPTRTGTWSSDDTSTTVALVATYRPPPRVVGPALDRLVLHRVAHVTVRGFLTRLVAGPAVSLR